MSLAAFPPYLVSHLRRLNVPGADTACQSKAPVKEHVTHPAFADSGSKVKAPVFGTMSSGTTAENTKAIAEENLFQAPDLAKDWEKLKEVPPLPVVEEGLAVPIWLWVVLGIGASVVFGGLAAYRSAYGFFPLRAIKRIGTAGRLKSSRSPLTKYLK